MSESQNNFLTPKLTQNSPLGPKKDGNDPKLSWNQKSELKETKKIKVVAL